MCQPGRPWPHGLSQNGSPGLLAFHSAKSIGWCLCSSTSMRAPAMHVVEPAPGELAVRRQLVDREVDVAVGGVGEPLRLELADERDHLGDVLGRRGSICGGGAAEHPHVLAERRRCSPPTPRCAVSAALLGALDDLVVDVGEVADERHLVAEEAQVAVDDVEDDQRARVADVRAVVDGDAADVHADLAGCSGTKSSSLPVRVLWTRRAMPVVRRGREVRRGVGA